MSMLWGAGAFKILPKIARIYFNRLDYPKSYCSGDANRGCPSRIYNVWFDVGVAFIRGPHVDPTLPLDYRDLVHWALVFLPF